MEKGDISNEVAPRLLMVWEGLIAMPPKEPAKQRRFSRAKVDLLTYTVNEAVGKHIWDLTYRRHLSVDVATFLDKERLSDVEEWIEYHDLPLGNVIATTPARLSRQLAFMPTVAAIYDPNPDNVFMYGGKGRIVNPDTPQFLGVIS